MQELSSGRDQKDPMKGNLWADFKPVLELKVKPRFQCEDKLDLFFSQLLLRNGAEGKPNPGLELSPSKMLRLSAISRRR